MNSTTVAMRRLVDRVAEAREAKTELDIRGGSTKDFYGNAARGQPLDVGDLQGITSYEPTELVVTVLAGTRLDELEGVLAERGQSLPFEPPRFGARGTVGGMVASGLSGPARASVGPVRDFVLGVTLLNGRAETLTFGGQVMKNVAGYDISRVIAGSMGILGVICEVSLKVMPVAPACRTLVFELDEAAALAALNRWSASTLPLNASAFHAGRLHVRLAGAKAAVHVGKDERGGLMLDPPIADEWWCRVRDHRHEFFVFDAAALERGECLWRLSVPDTAPPIALPGEQFIEWGGSLRWWRSTATATVIRAAAAAVGGQATLLRAADKSPGAFTPLTEPLLGIHRRLKMAFDPDGILNRGRLYPEL